MLFFLGFLTGGLIIGFLAYKIGYEKGYDALFKKAASMLR